MKILGFAGSNSKNSINKLLLEYTLNKIEGHEIKVLDLNDFEMPIYSIDRQQENGFPKEVEAFHQEIVNADAIVITLAEHNGTFSVALKNILDWVSRIDMSFLKGKKLLLLSTSPGGYGGGNVMEFGLKYFVQFAGGEVVANSTFPSFYDNFKDGEIINDELCAQINEQIEIFKNALVAVEA